MIDLGGRRNLLMHLDDARLPLTDGTAGILAGFAETSASSRSRSFVTSQHAVQCVLGSATVGSNCLTMIWTPLRASTDR
jgi:hypothetical protein